MIMKLIMFTVIMMIEDIERNLSVKFQPGLKNLNILEQVENQ